MVSWVLIPLGSWVHLRDSPENKRVYNSFPTHLFIGGKTMVKHDYNNYFVTTGR